MSVLQRDRVRESCVLTGVLSVVLAVSCTVSQPPVQGEWRLASPAEVGLDTQRLEELARALEAGTFENNHALLIVRHGRLVFEKYSSGRARGDLQYTASVSKSVGAIVFGMALADGALETVGDDPLDTPIGKLLPEYSTMLAGDSLKAQIQLRHVLTMTAGFQWDEHSYPYSDPRNDWHRASESDDPVALVLSKPMAAAPGTELNYNGGLSILLSYLVQRDLGIPVDAYARERLFGPLGIAEYRWERLSCGLTDTDGGLHLKPIDMAKIGQLFLDDGQWLGKQLVPTEWVHQSTLSHVANDRGPDYGFQWWCGQFRAHAGSTRAFLASGYGGQMILVAPALDLVVVLANQVFENPLGALNDLAILSRYIFPSADVSFARPEIQPQSPGSLGAYAGRYAADGEVVEVSLTENGLLAEAEGAPALQLQPLGPGQFFGTALDRLDVRFAFKIDDEGRCRSLTVWHGFRHQRFDRVGS
jgi:CubicO group peptidase (beta-lactamase class C family)